MNRTQKSPSRLRYSHRVGFTLIEIMIVVGLIALLCIIAIPSFIRSRAQSQKQVCLNNLRQINGAVEVWALENNKAENAPVTWNDIAIYVKSQPVCPAGGTTFDDSYTITTASEKAVCQRVPISHTLN